MTRRGAKATGVWVATILSALVFLGSGSSKVVMPAMSAQNFSHFGYPGWFAWVIGGAEILGAILLLIPRTATFGALVLGGVMVGAIGTHLSSGQTLMALVPLTLLVLVTFVGWARREGLLRWFHFKVPTTADQSAR